MYLVVIYQAAVLLHEIKRRSTVISSLHSFLASPVYHRTLLGLSLQVTGYDVLIIATGILSYGMYISRLFKRGTPPPIATWGLWLGIDAIAFYTDLKRGTLNLQLVTYTTGALVIVVVLVFRRNWAWNRYDTATLGATLGTVLVWQYTGNPSVGFWTSMGAFWIATIPLYLGLWKREVLEEPLDSWVVVTCGSVLSYLAGYPESAITLGLLQGLVMVLIMRNRYPNALKALMEEIR
jgi:hypothetical protein